MALQADRAKDRRTASSIAKEARELFDAWTAEEKAGYEGEIPWEQFKRELNDRRPPYFRPFQQH